MNGLTTEDILISLIKWQKINNMNRKEYNSDSRYRKVLEQMDLLGIMDITTTRQDKNGTVVWKLPIKDQYSGILIEVASFKTGYVRNQGKSTRSNFQLNKRREVDLELGVKPPKKIVFKSKKVYTRKIKHKKDE